jgi:hypothetical protein
MADISHYSVKLDLLKRGWVVLEPTSHACPYDLAVDRGNNRFESVQVKTISRDGRIAVINCRDSGHESTARRGKPHHYADFAIDWLAGVDRIDGRILYYPLHVYKKYRQQLDIVKAESISFPYNETLQDNTHRRIESDCSVF